MNVLPWQAKSPDMNPIEHLWDMLDRRVRKRRHQPLNVRELQNALVEEWNNIPQQEIQKLSQKLSQKPNEMEMHDTCECKWRPYEILIM